MELTHDVATWPQRRHCRCQDEEEEEEDEEVADEDEDQELRDEREAPKARGSPASGIMLASQFAEVVVSSVLKWLEDRLPVAVASRKRVFCASVLLLELLPWKPKPLNDQLPFLLQMSNVELACLPSYWLRIPAVNGCDNTVPVPRKKLV